MAKSLCDWSNKKLKVRRKALLRIVSEPRYGCRKCDRVACSKRYLCKAERLPAAASKKLALAS